MGNGTAEQEATAKWSWQFPLWAWGCQIAMAIIFRTAHGPLIGLINLAAALVEAGLVFGGLGLGLAALLRGGAADPSIRRHAIAGIILSGGTLLLVVVAIVVSLAGR